MRFRSVSITVIACFFVVRPDEHLVRKDILDLKGLAGHAIEAPVQHPCVQNFRVHGEAANRPIGDVFKDYRSVAITR